MDKAQNPSTPEDQEDEQFSSCLISYSQLFVVFHLNKSNRPITTGIQYQKIISLKKKTSMEMANDAVSDVGQQDRMVRYS
jgi:hypothetical protein